MIKKILAAAIIAAGGGSAFAQSGVTVGGIADAAARSVKNQGGSAVQSLVSGANSTSRLYLRGNEDLGSGLSASFWLESGIALDTGASAGGTQFFDRRSTVSLTSTSLGELRLGRDYIPSYTVWVRHDPFSHLGVAGSNNFTSAAQVGPIRNAFGTNPNTTLRSNNAVQYLLPGGLQGVEGGLMVAPGEGGTVANGEQKVVAGRIGWQSPSFGVHAAYTTTQNNMTASDKFKDAAAGVGGVFGPVRVNLAWRRYEQAQATQINMMVGAICTFGPFDLKASYLRANMKGRVGTTVIDANDANQVGIGAVYNLSKRTGIYGHASRLDNDGVGTFVIPGGATLQAGGRSTGFEGGIRHSF